ncbi:HNH endonuclease [Mycolicibacterium brumae]|uniref:HNH endonuclease n=1 Tax=Mycolicibacterium brumae TaxID=85968 RepID=A0A2G5P4T3_9MYCO|nr:HNH endonuclease [Mycolicibacterium brumae]MCV7191347.1 HNH endonuclease [Mycolicibacterium brumae]PIB73391.1 HNH endonuclease [Mycolicibacterium brumae]UWW07397.1 HNH endonuclease [Mycolicibacterium brumae]
MRTCRGCGSALTKRSQKSFCSNACQRAAERAERTKHWLETGEASCAGSHRLHYIRLHLAQAQSGRCAICGCSDVWQGEILAFVLDHIDGNPDNNRPENLRLVCPNCDSQLPTYKSRNRGHGRAFRRTRYANGQSY